MEKSDAMMQNEFTLDSKERLRYRVIVSCVEFGFAYHCTIQEYCTKGKREMRLCFQFAIYYANPGVSPRFLS